MANQLHYPQVYSLAIDRCRLTVRRRLPNIYRGAYKRFAGPRIEHATEHVGVFRAFAFGDVDRCALCSDGMIVSEERAKNGTLRR